MARFASDGTLKMLAYLTLLHDPVPPPFIGIEEPENFLHPRLLYGLAEECREAARATQVLVTTHSPFFLDALRPEEVRVLWRDESGYNPDAIRGGTWEAFERILQRHGHFRQGLAKMQAATDIGQHIDPAHNRSHSFAVFRDAIGEAVA